MDVAHAAFTDERHIGQIYELSGPRLMTMQDVVENLSEALGRPVQYHAVSVQDYAEELVQHGFSEAESLPVAQLIADVMDGRNATLTDGVQRALGREPKDFLDFAKDAAAAGTWNLEEKAS